MVVQKSKTSNAGFLLIEFLVGCSLLCLMALAIFPAINAYDDLVVSHRLEYSAKRLAADIVSLQGYAMYDGSGQNKLVMHSDRGGYDIYHSGEIFLSRRLDEESEQICFKQKLNALSFSVEGAPSASYNYIINATEDSSVSKTLQVQPITGRVVFK